MRGVLPSIDGLIQQTRVWQSELQTILLEMRCSEHKCPDRAEAQRKIQEAISWLTIDEQEKSR